MRKEEEDKQEQERKLADYKPPKGYGPGDMEDNDDDEGDTGEGVQ